MIEIIETFLVLWFLHCLADFSLQSNIMSNGKNKKASMDNWVNKLGRDEKDFDKRVWFYWMSAHALIQGGCIYLVFGNFWIFITEVITHFIIDYLKCAEITNLHQDQAMHISLRLIYTTIILVM